MKDIQLVQYYLKQRKLDDPIRKLLPEDGRLNNSTTTVAFLRKLYEDEAVEVAVALFTTPDGLLMGFKELARGTSDKVALSAKTIFSAALLCGADQITLAHNHPLGRARFSPADIRVTKKLAVAARTLEMTLWDHLVVTDDQWGSMREFGLLLPYRELMVETGKEIDREFEQAAQE